MEEYIELTNYVLDPTNYQNGLDLAYWYISKNNHSAAITYFLKTAELDNCPIDIKYECLIMIGYLYKTEGCRWKGVEQYATFAKAEQPERPEAYLLLCFAISDRLNYNKIFEQDDWLKVYENAKIGLKYATSYENKISEFYNDMEYLKMFYALSLLRLNKHEELREYLNTTKFKSINNAYIMNTIIYIYDEIRMRCPYTSYSSKNDILKVPFTNLDKIKNNYSQAMQDMFVLTALDGKLDGTYLEIGAGDPIYGNNTKLLEELGWKGLSIDWNQYYLNDFLKERKNPIINVNALKIDYEDLLKHNYNQTIIDYLSLDIDPPAQTLECLYKLPLDKYIFNVITFEHDAYYSGTEIKEQAKKILSKYGYVKVGDDIKYNLECPFEDWYVHKSIYTAELKNKFNMMFENSNGILHNIFFKK